MRAWCNALCVVGEWLLLMAVAEVWQAEQSRVAVLRCAAVGLCSDRMDVPAMHEGAGCSVPSQQGGHSFVVRYVRINAMQQR